MKKLFVLSGGVGSEREVSLSSGRNVVDTLRKEGLACEEIIVEADKSFLYNREHMTEDDGIRFLREENALVFQVIHGTYGEDGELVKKFEEVSVAYIGSSSQVLELTIDKYQTEKTLEKKGVATPHSVIVAKEQGGVDVEKLRELSFSHLPHFPLFIKPNKEGSSIGVQKVTRKGELQRALTDLFATYDEVLVQPFLTGREFSCGVVEIGGEEVALVPTEVILTKGELFDYEAKYSDGGCKEITPAEVDRDTTKKIQDLALLVHKVCGCKDISRTDMRMDENGTLIVLEINTVPGMTKTSFVPAELEASSYTLSQFVKGMLVKY